MCVERIFISLIVFSYYKKKENITYENFQWNSEQIKIRFQSNCCSSITCKQMMYQNFDVQKGSKMTYVSLLL